MTQRTSWRLTCLLLLIVVAVAAARPVLSHRDDQAKFDPATRDNLVRNGIEYLRSKGQAQDGSYSSSYGIGPTALVTTALLRHGVTRETPQVAKSLAYLEKHVQDDGGVYAAGSLYRNYETCLAILCFAEANHDGRYERLIRRAEAFVKGLQWDEGENTDPSDPGYGGGGYGKHQRPDLSNTSFLIDALRAAGNDADSEAIQRALIFISRCQNLESTNNTTPFSAKVNDGGFYYTPAAGGSSQAGSTSNGGLRSYGSMTYAGLKSMLYAGVTDDDPRVKAAVKWIGLHYDLGSNPGMGDAGLFYYYHIFAKALDAHGQDVFVRADGRTHDWRGDLIGELARRQRSDGSWVNRNDRWLEGDPNLSTGYALLALSYCR